MAAFAERSGGGAVAAVIWPIRRQQQPILDSIRKSRPCCSVVIPWPKERPPSSSPSLQGNMHRPRRGAASNFVALEGRGKKMLRSVRRISAVSCVQERVLIRRLRPHARTQTACANSSADPGKHGEGGPKEPREGGEAESCQGRRGGPGRRPPRLCAVRRLISTKHSRWTASTETGLWASRSAGFARVGWGGTGTLCSVPNQLRRYLFYYLSSYSPIPPFGLLKPSQPIPDGTGHVPPPVQCLDDATNRARPPTYPSAGFLFAPETADSRRRQGVTHLPKPWQRCRHCIRRSSARGNLRTGIPTDERYVLPAYQPTNQSARAADESRSTSRNDLRLCCSAPALKIEEVHSTSRRQRAATAANAPIEHTLAIKRHCSRNFGIRAFRPIRYRAGLGSRKDLLDLLFKRPKCVALSWNCVLQDYVQHKPRCGRPKLVNEALERKVIFTFNSK
ncbi:hypothetical protein LSTR_LSTR016849 [Laodelphax striatellus]|uniref:Uncharacterized protein n=1 Tax=Laodelphax striatellus TaxID=195883 RepID=A0A482XJG4_LAOST|nr:hypothetical protein LSTR_LSTR016849 [Laodelphax striatellus]